MIVVNLWTNEKPKRNGKREMSGKYNEERNENEFFGLFHFSFSFFVWRRQNFIIVCTDILHVCICILVAFVCWTKQREITLKTIQFFIYLLCLNRFKRQNCILSTKFLSIFFRHLFHFVLRFVAFFAHRQQSNAMRKIVNNLRFSHGKVYAIEAIKCNFGWKNKMMQLKCTHKHEIVIHIVFVIVMRIVCVEIERKVFFSLALNRIAWK